MASRRARVEHNSKVGRTSLVDRIDELVSTKPSTRLGVGCLQSFLAPAVSNKWLWTFAEVRGGLGF